MRKWIRAAVGVFLVLLLVAMVIFVVASVNQGSQRIEDISDDIDATNRADE